MEFPELGTHCSVQSCSRLDFLPFECDACHEIFCKDHKTYEQHNCCEGYVKDVKVPVCPLCSQPVPINRGEDPNIKVNEHIQKDCQSDKAKKLYTNRCSHNGCKKKELVPVKCNSCQRNFCLKHRHETDHNCQGHPNRLGGAARNPSSSRGSRSTASPSSGARRQQPINRNPQYTTMSQIGAELNRERQQRQHQRQHPTVSTSGFSQAHHMSEDEALARAIAASMNEATPQPGTAAPPPHAPPTSSQTSPPDVGSYDDDEALARAIAASLNEEQTRQRQRRTNPNPSSQQRQSNSDSGCHIS